MSKQPSTICVILLALIFTACNSGDKTPSPTVDKPAGIGSDSSTVEKKRVIDTAMAEAAYFRSGISEDESLERIRKFRDHYPNAISRGVWYEESDIRNYLDNILPILKGQFDRNIRDSIKIGFYFTEVYDTIRRHWRPDMLVIPTIVKNGVVSDYRLDPLEYPHSLPGHPIAPCSAGTPGCLGYDSGQMWP